MQARSAIVSRDGRYLILESFEDPTALSLVNTTTYRIVRTVSLPFSDDETGGTLALGPGDRTLYMADLSRTELYIVTLQASL